MRATFNVDLFESTEQWYRIYATNSVGESPASEVRGNETDEGAIPGVPLTLAGIFEHRRRRWC